MSNTLSILLLRFAIVVIAVFSLTCEKNNPVANGKPQLSASESPVVILVHGQKYITISGGQGSCLVQSVSDSNVITASINRFSYPYGRSLSLFGKSIGTAIIIVQDSAKTAEIEIRVTVAAMVASPSSVTIQVHKYQNVFLQGGTNPYAIDQPANSSIAKVNLSGSTANIEGVAPGSTTLVVKDNTNPPNKATISITVIPKPVLTTPGKISFSSSIKEFSANGILTDNLDNIVALLSNSEGAGGTLYTLLPGGNLGAIIGYKKQSQNIVDLVAIVFVKSSVSQGTLVIDSSQVMGGFETALVEFVFGGDLNSQTADTYRMHSGALTLSAFSTEKATGTFNGAATLFRNNLPVIGSTATVTNGTFDVPVLQDNLDLTAPTFEQKRIIGYTQKIIKGSLMDLSRNK